MSAGPELLYREAQCIGCRSCAKVCPEKAIPEENGPAGRDPAKCRLCGTCADECPSGALTLVGKYYTPDELVETLAKDKAFYDNSGGGVTLSGGEPTLAMDYTAEAAKKLKERGIHVLLETCGDFDWERFSEKLLPYVDRVFVDMKLCAPELHQKYTRRDNDRIKPNIERLLKIERLNTLVRVPLIPEVTATRENLEAIAQWMRERGLARIALLPYNPLWLAKARGLQKNPAYSRDTWMSKEEREQVKKIFEGFEIERDI